MKVSKASRAKKRMGRAVGARRMWIRLSGAHTHRLEIGTTLTTTAGVFRVLKSRGDLLQVVRVSA